MSWVSGFFPGAQLDFSGYAHIKFLLMQKSVLWNFEL